MLYLYCICPILYTDFEIKNSEDKSSAFVRLKGEVAKKDSVGLLK